MPALDGPDPASEPSRAAGSAAAPLLMLVARPILALGAQAAMATLLRKRGVSDGPAQAAGWWMVYGSAVDAGCLALLAAAARHEGQPVMSALGLQNRPPRPARAALADVAFLVPAAALSQLVSRPFTEDGTDQFPLQLRLSRLRGAARVYSVAVFPALWSFAEEATYLGYALPRLERRLGALPAAALTALAWAAQHAAIPALPSRRYAVSRVVTMLPVSAAFIAVYLARGRRLAPLIAAHWALDVSAAGLAAYIGARP